MMNELILLIAILLGACVVLLIVLLVRQNSSLRAQENALIRQENELEHLGNQLLGELDSQRDQTLDSLYQGNQHLMNTLSQMGGSQSTLLENMLASVYKGLGEMRSVSDGVSDLRKVMTNVKTRGIWGEMQLGNLIRQALAPGQFAENVEVIPGSGERVEFAIRLPDQQGNSIWLPIDSKFPQESYLRLVDAEKIKDPSAAEEARKALYRRIRSEAKTISEKYVSPPHTTDFALMFLATESLYTEILQSPDLVEGIQRDYRVVISGPGTFSAMLNTLQMGFRSLTIEQRASDVQRLLQQVEKDFSRFTESLEDARRKLSQAEDVMDTLSSKARTLQRRLKDLDSEDVRHADGPSGLL